MYKYGEAKMNSKNPHRLTLGAMFFALGLVLPFLTAQIPQIGNMSAYAHTSVPMRVDLRLEAGPYYRPAPPPDALSAFRDAGALSDGCRDVL